MRLPSPTTAMIGPLLFLPFACTGGTGATPPREATTIGGALQDNALEVAKKLRATRMGVTRQGELWAWDQRTGAVQLVSPAGELRAGPGASHAEAIDVDSEWGVAALVDHGAALQIFPADGPHTSAIRLDNPSEGVAWMGRSSVAVSPSLSASRVEVWDLASRTRSSVWGEEQPVASGPGVALRRIVDLRYDHGTRLLYTLDTFTGDLQVFGPEGKAVRRAGAAHPRQAEVEAWLKQRDAEARDAGMSERPSHRQWDGFSVAPDATVWMVEHCKNGEKRVTMRRLPEQDPPATALLDDVGCCSYRFTLWAGALVMHRDPYGPVLVCNSVLRRFP